MIKTKILKMLISMFFYTNNELNLHRNLDTHCLAIALI